MVYLQSVLISGCWNKEVPLYREVFSFQLSGIEKLIFVYSYISPSIPTPWNEDNSVAIQ